MNMATFENLEGDDKDHLADRSAKHQRSAEASKNADDLLGASLHYVAAQTQVLQDSLDVLKAEAHLGLLRLATAGFSVAAAILLLLVSWVLLMIGVAEGLSVWLTVPGSNVLVLALLNLALAVTCYLFGRNLLRKLANTRPFAGLSI